ncbi:MAG: type II toxin-antitoxin system VapB family antitoxin [Nocardioides sp.]
MSRTNIELDDAKLDWVMKTYGIRTKRDAVDFALSRLVTPYRPADMLDLVGNGWVGDLETLRE